VSYFNHSTALHEVEEHIPRASLSWTNITRPSSLTPSEAQSHDEIKLRGSKHIYDLGLRMNANLLSVIALMRNRLATQHGVLN
jgi:hypothetical protein